MRRHAVIRGALEDVDVTRLRGDHRDRLDRGRPRADHADGLAGEVHRLMRPAARVIGRPLEALLAFELRLVRQGQTARRHDAVAGGDHVALVGPHRPSGRRPIERRLNDAGVEVDIPAQVISVGDVVGVFQEFGLRRVALRPLPFPLQRFVEGEGVFLALDIDPRARIAVPEPGAADARARLDDTCGEAKAPQAMQHVEAGKACADNDGVKRLHRLGSLGAGRHEFLP